MTSPKQKRKGYLLPEQIDDHDLICVSLKIPNVREYRAAFLGQIHAFGKWWTWEKSYTEGDTRAKDAAQYWRQLLDEFLCIGEGAQMTLRQNSLDPCLLEQVDCNGNWTTVFDFSRCASITPSIFEINFRLQQETQIAYDIINRYDGSDITTINNNLTFTNYDNAGDAEGQAALCIAVSSYVRGVSATFAQKARLQLGLTLAGTALVTTFLGPLGIVVGAALLAGTILIAESAISAAEDLDAQNDVICCMVAGLTGEAITTGNFASSLDSCSFTGGTNEAILRDVIAADLGVEGNWILFLDKLGQAVPLAEVGVIDCPCEEWSHTFFGVGNEVPDDFDSFDGVWDATNEWYYITRAQPHSQSTLGFDIRVNSAAPFTVTRLIAKFKTIVGQPFSARGSVLKVDGVGVKTLNTTNSGTYTVDTGQISRTATESVGIYASARTPDGTCAPCSGDRVEIQEFTVKGTGFDPFV